MQALLQQCQTGALREKETTKLVTAYMLWLRRILGVTRRNKCRIENIRRLINIVSVRDYIARQIK